MTRIVRATLGVALAASVAATDVARAAASDQDPLIAHVAAGELRGMASASDASIRVYRGVPFAAPPVGPLRWRPPAAVASWQGAREATTFAPPCAQTERPGRAGSAVIGSEDCLYLNVWTGAKRGARRPVLVWIHGGGMRRGSASDPARDGSALAAQGLVVVSVAYRLGVLGFFSHPLLSAESEHDSSGTYVVLDLVAALRWIADNVDGFGGDPSNVTIFGQSGGARAVQYLQATPLARGLFQRAIAHSSGSFEERTYLRDPPPGGESAEAVGEQWAAAMLDGAGAAAPASAGGARLAALRALPVEHVVGVIEGLLPHYSLPVDRWVLPDTTRSLFAAGKQTDVPILVGWNGNEAAGMADSARAPGDAAEFVTRVAEEFGDAAPRFTELYPPGDDPRAAFLRGHGVETFGWNMRAWARAMRTVRSPAFLYHFERSPSTPPGTLARHGAELAYVFGNLDSEKQGSAADRERARLMMSYWIAFATAGDPNAAVDRRPGDAAVERPRWERYTAETDQTMLFGERVELRRGVRATELQFFDDFFEAQLSSDAGP
jgi:para-nitrobenzyl esterase